MGTTFGVDGGPLADNLLPRPLPGNTQGRRFTKCLAAGNVSAGESSMNFNFSVDLKQFRGQARRLPSGEETFAADLWRAIAATVQSASLSSTNARIARGSDKTLRNIVAERGLGLAPDIRVDKANQVPTGRR